MRKLMLYGLILAFISACSHSMEPVLDPAPDYNAAEAVERFLTAQDSVKESQVIAELEAAGITIQQVKSLIRERKVSYSGKPGQHLDLKLASQDQEYSYALFAPELKPETQYPLVIILHGAGGNGESTLQKWMERLGDEFIIVCPSYPMGAWWSSRAETLVLDLLQQVRSEYPVDDNRVLLAGLSNGAIGAYLIGMFHPDYFAGIVPIAGTVTERYMHFLVNLAHTPLYSIQGIHDPIFPIDFSRRIKKIMEDLKYPSVFREHSQRTSAHGGHFLPAEEVPPLVDWMRQQKRILNPANVRMVREGNHLEPLYWTGVSKGFQLASLQIPGPEGEKVNVQDGKIATLVARLKGNEIDLQGNNVLENELLLNSELIDFSKPLLVTFEKISDEGGKWVTESKRVVFNDMVHPSLQTLLSLYKKRRDPHLLYEAQLKISLEEKVQVAQLP